jgi:spoIIIJ-associated protein
MSEKVREVEVRGQDVEDAIETGLQELGVERSEVTVEVVDEGARGLLGIGSREAVVRVRISKMEPEELREGAEDSDRPGTDEVAAASTAETELVADEVEVDLEEAAVQVVQDLLDKMHVSATVTTHLTEPDDLTGNQIYVVDVRGDDLGMLIGARGETLNAIQHISRLMVGHRIRRRANFIVDVQGYRKRREQALSRLAERMAKKVSTRRRPVILEPMPPHERRIIHVALREDEQVYTQSTGEGKRRRVRILPKEDV